MRSKRAVVLSFALAVGLGMFAQAQQRQFNDVPAGHWARQAVEFAVQCGLVEGFPDGTFRGNSNLTRYQIALIFFRLFQSQQSANVSPECRLGVQQAAQSAVGPELQALQQRFEQLEAANRDRDTRMAALEAEVKAASEATKAAQAAAEKAEQSAQAAQQAATQAQQGVQGATTAAQQAQQTAQAAQEAATKAQQSADGVQQTAQAAQQAATQAGQKADTAQETASKAAALQQRLDALETQVKQIATQPAPATQPQTQAPAGPTPAELQTRIGALEEQVKRLAAAPAAPTATQDAVALERRIATLEAEIRNRPDAARVAALEEQVRALNGQITTLQGQVNELRTAAAQPQPPAQPQQPAQQPAQPQQPQQPAQPELRPVTPTTPTPERRVSNFYLGAGVGLNNVLASGSLGDQFNAGGFVGLRNLVLGFGVRAGANYTFSGGGLAAQAFITRDLNPGGFNPYAGIGATIALSGATNVYGTALLGIDVINLGPLAVFAEVTPQFLGNGFGIGTKAGLKLNF